MYRDRTARVKRDEAIAAKNTPPAEEAPIKNKKTKTKNKKDKK